MSRYVYTTQTQTKLAKTLIRKPFKVFCAEIAQFLFNKTLKVTEHQFTLRVIYTIWRSLESHLLKIHPPFQKRKWYVLRNRSRRDNKPQNRLWEKGIREKL